MSPHSDAFSNDEYERRRLAVLRDMSEGGLDGLVVTSPSHQRYLTGYDGAGGYMAPFAVVVTHDHPLVYVTRSLDEDNVRYLSHVQSFETYVSKTDFGPVMARCLSDLGLHHKRIGMELDCWGIAPADVQEIAAGVPTVEIVDASKVIVSVSDIKSREEQDVMRRAMAVSRAGIDAFFRAVGSDITEAEAADQVSHAMVTAGGESPPWNIRTFTLLFGRRTALPHGWPPLETRLESGDVAYTELSGFVSGYAAALLRTALRGRNSRAEQLYGIVEAALDAAIQQLWPGNTAERVDASCRRVVSEAGFGDGFTRRTGYAIGVHWYERGNTSLEPGETTPIRPGMTFHLPIFLFEKDQFAVGCSETVLVTETGPEVLSGLQHSLFRV